MSDNEYERFEITDYDLDNEFNVNRPRRRQTKQQQIYGIWADDSDNDSVEEPTGRRGRRARAGLGQSGGAHKPKDYAAPVSFVAGGVQQYGKKKKQQNDADVDDVEQQQQITDEDEDEQAASDNARQLGHAADTDNTSSDSEAEQQTARATAQNKTNAPAKSSRHVGAWEQHTRGIGAKLLLQMGYEPGKGLGKDLQGISQPVEAHVRKGRGAIGAYGPETAASIGGKQPQQQQLEDAQSHKSIQQKSNKWKKSNDGQGSKTKRYYYTSVEELLEKGKKDNNLLSNKISKKLGNVPVIDMTGPEKRVLSGYHALAQTKVLDEDLYEVDDKATKKASTAGFALPELMHNLNLIVSLCEQEIIALDKAEREASDKQAYLEHERKNLQQISALEQQHIQTLQGALKLVEELTNDNSAQTLSLERAERIFVTLQTDYAAEYKEFGLGDLAAGILAPMVKQILANWQPLQQPTAHIDLIKKWRSILDMQSADVPHETRNVFDPYSSLIWAGVIPSFRACSADWQPKQHQLMAALLDAWAPLFPTWILDSVLEQLVLPRLSTGVREWDPLTDTVPIHIWILPWNAILGHKMEEYIFPTIREKLGAALQTWMPQDRSARAMLTPWKEAFDATQMQMFLLQHIVPKLQLVLSSFIIDPLQQDLEPWNQVWEWHELIPAMLMAQMLDKYFFPKWMQVLVLWLNQSPNFVEISRWYSGWKSLLSEAVLREPNIKEHFRRALEIMHRATDAGLQTPISNTPPPPQPPPAPAALLELQLGASTAQLEFKELVSQKCAERGILFAPLPGRRELGKQIYRVGKLFCYIDRNVCLVSDGSLKNWLPTSLPQMLERANIGLV